MSLMTNTIEKKIFDRIVSDALGSGYNISLNDGEEWTVRGSTDALELSAASASTECDMLRFRDGPDPIGMVWLIWGNGCDLIHDYTDNNEMDAMMKPVMDYANSL
tara:strand:- start:684 stop:998 length:315 start_codon:yes stop_codon:yes gene_type:complete